MGMWDFPDSPVAKNLPCNARDPSSVPGPGRCHMPNRAAKPVHHEY